MGMPLYIRIQQYIKAQIDSGEWEANSAIPTETELSRQFGCSRITVTNALRELVKDGIIYRIQGKGTYVSKQKDAMELYEKANLAHMQLSLESMVVPGEHKCLNMWTEHPNEEIAKILAMDTDQTVIVFDRVKYADGKVFAAERVYLPQLLYASAMNGYTKKSLADEKIEKISEACGIVIGKSYISSQPYACDGDIAKLLDVPEGSAVLRFCIEIHDVQERPVACEFAFAKGEQHKIVIS